MAAETPSGIVCGTLDLADFEKWGKGPPFEGFGGGPLQPRNRSLQSTQNSAQILNCEHSNILSTLPV